MLLNVGESCLHLQSHKQGRDFGDALGLLCLLKLTFDNQSPKVDNIGTLGLFELS